MRMLSRVKLNWSNGGWFWFWTTALLVLPNCTLDRGGTLTPTNLNRGDIPRGSVIFCDIEKPPARRCATPGEDLSFAIRLKGAAEALVAGRSSMFGLDDSPDAVGMCAPDQPQVVEYQGPFPQGTPVCVNCASAIGPGPGQHASNAEVCIAHCLDLFDPNDGNVPPSAAALAWCTPQRARLSTNFPISGICTDLACNTVMGGLSPTFDDQRKRPEPVSWTNLDGVTAGVGSLTRLAATTGDYDAGASSFELIAGGDAYVEFTATEINRARVVGLSSGPPPAGGVTFFDIGFGILLTETDEMFVVENGPAVSSFGAYAAGQRYRIKLRDNFDGSASVSYVRVDGPCVDGSPCNETEFHPSDNTAMYPVRVDAMFKEQGGTVTEPRLVRIR